MLKTIPALVVGLVLMVKNGRAERLKIGQWPILAQEPGCRVGELTTITGQGIMTRR